jgi:hypothetical protein
MHSKGAIRGFILYLNFFLEIKWKNLNLITLFSQAMMRVETTLVAAMTLVAEMMLVAAMTLAAVKKALSKYFSFFTCF